MKNFLIFEPQAGARHARKPEQTPMKFTFGRQQNDSELISAIIRGDVGAYEQLFVRYYPTLLHFIRGMLKDDHMSEDIAQNIFMKLWIHREKLLMQGISKMPPRRQLIFRMSRYEHLSNREIAERLGLSVRTVDKHIELALKDLHSTLC